MQKEKKCIHCKLNSVYSDDKEKQKFEEIANKNPTFVLPKRCKPCRKVAIKYFEEKRQKEVGEFINNFDENKNEK